jgi:hypothetical protein
MIARLLTLCIPLLATACTNPPPQPVPTATKTVTVATPVPSPPPAAVAAPVHSALAGIDLPPGTMPASAASQNGEFWNAPTSYDYTVQFLRQQLPISKDFQGLPWCLQEINAKLGLTKWVWATDTKSLEVDVSDGGSVMITHGDPSWTRQDLGCQ